jgi:hypothetical protein
MKISAGLTVILLGLAVSIGPWIVGGLVAWHFIAKYW